MFYLCTESWTKLLKIDFKSSLSVLSLWLFCHYGHEATLNNSVFLVIHIKLFT